jgi:phosphohistidine phosphatase
MRTVYLLRHAKSSWKDAGLEDFDRPLASRGRRAATAIGRYLRAQAIEPALILCSPAKRARQTLERLQETIAAAIPTRFEKAIYMAEPGPLLQRLQGLSDSLPSVMIVGHNPGLEQLAALLIGSGDKAMRQEMARKFPTAALAVIEAAVDHWSELKAGDGRLTLFVRGREQVSTV